MSPINTLGVSRREVAADAEGELHAIEAEPMGVGRIIDSSDRVIVREADSTVTLENAALRATLHHDGRLLNLMHKSTGRETLGEPGNLLLTYDDKPTKYEAWDIDPYALETEKPCAAAESCRVTRQDALRAEVTFERTIGRRSRMTQVVRLDAESARLEFHAQVDWQESQVLLKVAFPVAVRSMQATYEMPFGMAERPTHVNDQFALARFEVPGHRWSDLSEHGFGVALLSDSKYGYATRGSTMSMSLLRSTKAPDPDADMGSQAFAYALYPHQGDWRDGGVVAEGLRFNQPPLWCDTAAEPGAWLNVDNDNLVLDTVKRAEDSDAIIVRLYECHGSRGSATLRTRLPVSEATWCNVLEDDLGPAPVENGQVRIEFGPHQIISLKLR